MTVYLITYDLNSEDRDYKTLYDEIENLGKAQRMLKSVWLVNVDGLNAKAISEKLREVMDTKDLLYVVKNDKYDRHGWMYSSNWEWLRNNT